MEVNWAQILFNSAITGSIYLLGAVGLSVTYRLSGFPNFAHAEFITLGAFISYFVAEELGVGLPGACLAAFMVTGIFGFLCYRGIFQPLSKRGASIIHLMVASIALGFVLRHVINAVWTDSPYYFTTVTFPSYNIGAVTTTSLYLWLVFIALALSVGMHLVLTRTEVGKAIRATSSNPDLALASGINTERVIGITWFVGAGLAAVAGVVRGVGTLVNPMIGWEIILPIFAVVILGGIGNYYGAIAAAFIIGLAENVGVVALMAVGLSAEYRIAIAFLILIITLIARPQGLAMLFRRA